jgi:hypothetical protein
LLILRRRAYHFVIFVILGSSKAWFKLISHNRIKEDSILHGILEPSHLALFLLRFVQKKEFSVMGGAG